ncbi:MAG TPA: hypothetical protein PLL76_19550 [Thermoanaerobaculia bacterium]|nr:hypothetical protein [Thermoanaerobaculia bacterium]
MQKIDRLGWAAGFSFRAYGLLIGVRASRADVLADLRSCLPFGAEITDEVEVDYLYSIIAGGPDERGRVRRFHIVYADAVQLGRSTSWDALLEAFATDLELFVGEHARGRVFVHAGVVGWQGGAIVLPGRTLSGKSALVAELVRAGATYYSDEFAILDEGGLVHPFQRPIMLRSRTDPGAAKRTPQDLSACQPAGAAPVDCVLFTRFRPGARFRPKPISPGAACLEILKHTLSARTQPELVLPVLRAVTERAQAYRSPRGEAAEVVPAVLALSGSGIATGPRVA